MTRKKLDTDETAIASGAALAASPLLGSAEERLMISRPIHASGERLPVIGLGTYSVFDVDSTPESTASRKEIIDLLVGEGGSLIDTSPMYKPVRTRHRRHDFGRCTLASPCSWPPRYGSTGRDAGAAQMQRSAELMQTDVIDLMQVHNLRDTAVHMPTIRQWQEEGSHSLQRPHPTTAPARWRHWNRAARAHKPQFVQINYSLGEREGRQAFPAADAGHGRFGPDQSPLPGRPVVSVPSAARSYLSGAGEFASSWGQFFLKFIISHPAVTCVIPATSKPHHMQGQSRGRVRATARRVDPQAYGRPDPGTVNAAPSSLLRRVGAMLYDALLITALLFLATVPFIAIEGGESIESRSGVLHVIYQLTLVSVTFAYFAGYWTRPRPDAGHAVLGIAAADRRWPPSLAGRG